MSTATDFEQALAGFQFQGKEVAPWSPSRKVAAQSMGLLFPFIGESGQRQYQATGVYKGAVKDVCIFLWLCSLPDFPDRDKPGQWTPSAALHRPEEAATEAVEWGSREGILDFNSPLWSEAFQLFTAVLSGMAASDFQIEIERQRTSGPQEESEGSDGPKV